jgi:AcrR family transcriptional regulator
MPNDKESKMDIIANKTLYILERYGHDAVTFSRVAASTKISRPWIYKYIGKTKEDLMNFAVDHFGKKFALIYSRPQPQDIEQWNKMTVAGFERILNETQKNPWIIIIYFQFRGSTTPLGIRIAHLENLFLKENSKEIQSALNLDSKKAKKFTKYLLAIRMGLVHNWITNNSTQDEKIEIIEFFSQFIELTKLI